MSPQTEYFFKMTKQKKAEQLLWLFRLSSF